MPDRFDEFWAIYPLRVGKGSARKAWAKAIKRAEFEAIKAGVVNYIAHKPAWQNWAHAATWLNGERWLDQYDYNGPAPKTREESRLRNIASAAKRPWAKGRYPAPDLRACVDAGLLTKDEMEAAL